MALDVSSLNSVRAFVQAFQSRGFGGLHVLINNAGVMLKVYDGWGQHKPCLVSWL